MHDSTRKASRLTVTTDGDHVVPHAGAATLRLAADRTGLTAALPDALRRDEATRGHDRGRVVTDTAVMASGGNTMRAIDILRHAEDLLGAVASPATVCRTLGELDAAAVDRVEAARAIVRSGSGP